MFGSRAQQRYCALLCSSERLIARCSEQHVKSSASCRNRHWQLLLCMWCTAINFLAGPAVLLCVFECVCRPRVSKGPGPVLASVSCIVRFVSQYLQPSGCCVCTTFLLFYQHCRLQQALLQVLCIFGCGIASQVWQSVSGIRVAGGGSIFGFLVPQCGWMFG